MAALLSLSFTESDMPAAQAGRAFPVMGSAPASKELTPGVRFALDALKSGCYDGKAPVIIVDIARQSLLLFANGQVKMSWLVSTSKYGTGSQPRSFKTPLGLHRIWKKSGASARIGEPLTNGEPSEKPRPEEGGKGHVYISTRAMMLDGLEKDNKTSKSRGIWIHGTTAEDKIGKPASIGCVRMRNVDVVELFKAVSEGTLVYITDKR